MAISTSAEAAMALEAAPIVKKKEWTEGGLDRNMVGSSAFFEIPPLR
ncbi:MAG: hypothetical protein KF789_01510 [Bdellovibrionaceae bacterium]|nr:hypothetical protein [Pseudobdellovibrionaceae bacterium]